MYQIVKLTFPFVDNFDKGKPRPALVVSPSKLGIVGTLPNPRISEVKEKLMKVFQLK